MIEASAAALRGAHHDGEGVHFCVFSSCAERVELALFDAAHGETARHDLQESGDGDWCGFLPGLGPGQRYGYRVHGPYDPERGLRSNPNKLLIDPCARKLDGAFRWAPPVYDFLPGSAPGARQPNQLDSAACVPKSVVSDHPGKAPHGPRIPWTDRVIYELNLRGFTMRHPDLPGAERGRFSGLSNGQILDYLCALGITSIELQPVQAFIDERFLRDGGRRNFWGYNSISYLALASRYAHADPVAEFLEMVRAIHDAGLEVILDVAYNHTAEGGADGPTLSFRGLDNLAYYQVNPGAPGQYLNASGCGNTTNVDHPVFQDLVMDSLDYFHNTLGVDGFRFDLAASLGRSGEQFSPDHPLLKRIGAAPALRHAQLIAEPWDIGHDGYQLGRFPGRWSEWNDRYRDAVRQFWRGDGSVCGDFASALHGSADVFEPSGRGPGASINFVTSHDGFTLMDLVSYQQRHNHANGEDNRDGHSHNYSANFGHEGISSSLEINAARRRQRLNLLASALLSQGTPMILAGDEFGNSQQGNNNAYCQDNETGWVDWSGLEEDPDFRAQIQRLLELRRQLPLLRQGRYIHGRDGPRIDWLHLDGHAINAHEWTQVDAFMLRVLTPSHAGQPQGVLLVINRASDCRSCALPDAPGEHSWHVEFQTALWQPAQPLSEIPPGSLACLVSGD
jgi:glycogen operon protein